MSRCACCRAETDADGLCSDCAAVAEAIEGATVDTQRHLLAYALVRSQRDAARRLDKAPTAHNSALGNFARRTGVDRETARRVAVWGLRTGVWQRPAGFEDVSLPEGPGAPSRNGEVKVTQTEPAPGARKKSPKPSKVHSYNFDKEARQVWKDEHEPQPEPADEDPACYGCTNDTSECDTCELTGPCADEAANQTEEEDEDMVTLTDVLEAQCDAEMRERPKPSALCPPNCEYDCGGCFRNAQVVARMNAEVPPVDLALEALKRIATPHSDSQVAADLIIVAYELGKTRASIGGAS